jgi:hypothetical protein
MPVVPEIERSATILCLWAENSNAIWLQPEGVKKAAHIFFVFNKQKTVMPAGNT